MSLHSYGLLIGKIDGFRVPQGRRPHWVLFVQPGDQKYPRFRVALNVPDHQARDNSEIEYRIVDLPPGHALVKRLRALAVSRAGPGVPQFLLADEDKTLPRLNYCRDGLVKASDFPSERRGESKVGPKSAPQSLLPLHRLLRAATKPSAKAEVAVFGTGYPTDHRTGEAPATGFTGVDNVHMNQGAFNRTSGTLHYLENSKSKDGALFILWPDKVTGVFIKFRSQTIDTDKHGRPLGTGIPQLDGVSAAIRKAIMPKLPRALLRPPARPRSLGAAAAPAAKGPQPGYANAQKFVFADVNPADASGEFIADEDAGTYQTPIVQQQGKGSTRGPVPVPRENPVMSLQSVVGANPPGYADDANGRSIAFDIIGDSGAPSESKLKGYERKVGDLLANDAAASPPAFMFHVGDVVYFYGEKAYYYSQFYEPFRAYPAPIFAIPGNHDGIVYEDSQVSLADFQSAFCAREPARWPGSGGILRTAMTQPGVYFTLEAPLVSIIGLYSNCGESMGWLDEPQYLFLYNELVRLKAAKRPGGLPAVVLAIHHFPRWFPKQSKPDPMSIAIDATFKKAGFWPDAVICGHAHLYQRVVRQGAGADGRQDIPYIMSGAGGYGINPSEQVGKAYMQQIGVSAGKPSAMGCVVNESGYVRVTVSQPARGNPALKFEYRSVAPKSSVPDDSCELDLKTGRIVT